MEWETREHCCIKHFYSVNFTNQIFRVKLMLLLSERMWVKLMFKKFGLKSADLMRLFNYSHFNGVTVSFQIADMAFDQYFTIKYIQNYATLPIVHIRPISRYFRQMPWIPFVKSAPACRHTYVCKYIPA